MIPSMANLPIAETKSNPYSEMMNHLKELETCTLKLVDAVEALGEHLPNDLTINL